MMNSTYFHWSPQRIKHVYCNSQTLTNKPRGLYFSRDNRWIEYCIRTDWKPRYRFCYRIENQHELNILDITTKTAEQFEISYPIDDSGFSAQWQTISAQFDGLFISQEVIDCDNDYWNADKTPTTRKWRVPFWADFDVESLVIWSSNARISMVKEQDPWDLYTNSNRGEFYLLTKK